MEPPLQESSPESKWLVGGGMMGEKIRAVNWSESRVGPLAVWPQSLRTAVGICLRSPLPMFVWWGPELINIYNDAYASVLGKRHPAALGEPAREVWLDIWPSIEADVDRVILHGESVVKERVRFIMERNGYPEETYFTYSHSPIPDESGGIGGLFQVCTDETSAVFAEREREHLAKQREEAEKLAGSILESVTDGFFSLDHQWHFTYANAQAGRILVRPKEQLLGKIIWDEYPGLYGSVFEPVYRRAMDERVATSITSFYPDHDCWYDVRCYPSDNGLSVYFQNVTELKRSELAREQLVRTVENERSRLHTVIEQAPAFICVLHGPDHKFEFTNDLYLQLVGKSDILGKTVRQVVPEVEAQGYLSLLDQVYRTGKPFKGNEMPLQLRRTERDDLETRFLNFVYQPLKETDGSVSGILVHGIDLTDLVLSRKAVETSEAKYRGVLSALEEGIALHDATGAITVANHSAEQIFGLTLEQLQGRNTFDPRWRPRAEDGSELPGDKHPTHMALQTGQAVTNYVMAVHRPDGTLVWVSVNSVPLRDSANGQITGAVTSFFDISDRRKIEQERERLLASEREARGDAERASRMKDEFLATLSHELRTPLNAILGWAQILSNGSRDEEDLAEGLRTIERNARAQTQIIDDLLDMSRIISGKVRLDVQQVDLIAVVQAAVDTLRPAADAKGVRVQTILDPQAGPVSGDPNRLQQVFWNLLTNAVKFTPRAGRVQVLLERVSSHLEVTVTDTGEGISPDFLPHIFDRFRQSDASTTRKHGGLGLGLAIVKQLVELHGGTVRAKSAGGGKGSSFVVALPVTAIHAEPESSVERRHPRAQSTPILMSDLCERIAGVKALVVDDEPDARALLKRLLEECKAVVIVAASPAEALERVMADRPDILVSDIGMPGEDGYSLIRRIRALGAGKGGNVPAIALTAYARAEDRMNAVIAGFQMHITKPVEPTELITMIAALTRQA